MPLVHSSFTFFFPSRVLVAFLNAWKLAIYLLVSQLLMKFSTHWWVPNHTPSSETFKSTNKKISCNECVQRSPNAYSPVYSLSILLCLAWHCHGEEGCLWCRSCSCKPCFQNYPPLKRFHSEPPVTFEELAIYINVTFATLSLTLLNFSDRVSSPYWVFNQVKIWNGLTPTYLGQKPYYNPLPKAWWNLLLTQDSTDTSTKWNSSPQVFPPLQIHCSAMTFTNSPLMIGWGK